MNLWVVAPVYDDVPSFLKLREIVRSLPIAKRFEVRFVLIDDSAGADPKVDREAAVFQDVQIIRPEKNMGPRKAIVFALRLLAAKQIAKEDVIVTLDADGQDRPEDVPALVDALLGASRPDSVAIAVRTSRTDSAAFKFWLFVFRWVFRILVGKTVRNGNFVAFSGELAKESLSHPMFDLCYASAFEVLPFEKVAVPLARGERWFGESKMSWLDLITHAARMFLPFKNQIIARSLAFASAAAILLFAASHFARQMK